MAKDVNEGIGDDSPEGWITMQALHGVSLPSASLSIHQDCAIIPS